MTKRIFICDDEPDIIELIATLLELEFDEIEIDKFDNSEQGLEYLKNGGQEYSLIISDLNMPGVSGVDIFNYNSQSKNTPMILISGDDSPSGVFTKEFIQEFSDSNTKNKIIVKPWGDDEFMGLITDLLAS